MPVKMLRVCARHQNKTWQVGGWLRWAEQRAAAEFHLPPKKVVTGSHELPTQRLPATLPGDQKHKWVGNFIKAVGGVNARSAQMKGAEWAGSETKIAH